MTPVGGAECVNPSLGGDVASRRDRVGNAIATGGESQQRDEQCRNADHACDFAAAARRIKRA